MKITREENSISWQDRNSAGSIGIISTQSWDDRRQQQYDSWAAYCASKVRAEPHTVPEAIAWMQERWDVEPLEPDNIHLQMAYANMVMQFCPDKLSHDPGEFSMDLSDAEFEQWHKATEARRREAEQLPPEDSGLYVHGFRLPPTNRNLPDMEADSQRFMQRYPEAKQSIGLEDCMLIFEETHRNLQINGVGAGVIGRKIGVYLGLSQEDIDSRSPRFLGYISDGPEGLPTLEEFSKEPERYINE